MDNYISVSQRSITVIIDGESENGRDVYIVNDSQNDICLNVSIYDIIKNKKPVFNATFSAKANTSVKIGRIDDSDAIAFYQIVWDGSDKGYNHFTYYDRKMDMATYMKALRQSLYGDYIKDIF